MISSYKGKQRAGIFVWCFRPSRMAYHRLLNMHDGEMPGVHIVHKDRHLLVRCVSNGVHALGSSV